MIVLGIDPGSRYVGLAVRNVSRAAHAPEALLGWDTIDRKATDDHRDLATWVAHVLDVAFAYAGNRDVDVIAVEAATAPSPHLGMTNPAGIIDAAILVGAVLGRFGRGRVVVIDQGGHGAPVPKGATAKLGRQILEASYPPDLIGARETTGRGKSPRQHARAAWDVAGAATLYR